MQIENSECVTYTPQWQEKLGWKLFPSQHIDSPEMMGQHDVLVCRVTCFLSFLDRIRALISGKIEVTAKTSTENFIGKSLTSSCVSVRPPYFLERKE